ncbi:hypothetical protein J6TS7_14670 [Paenibacillus dendritiformis]|nr:hypothetical protein J6TS7_14670 [Paenibacillus dendritiformis]
MPALFFVSKENQDLTGEMDMCGEDRRALATMVDRSPIKGKTIVLADPGYESYNNSRIWNSKGGAMSSG